MSETRPGIATELYYKAILELGEERGFVHPGESVHYDSYAFVVRSPGQEDNTKGFVNPRPLCQLGMHRFKFATSFGRAMLEDIIRLQPRKPHGWSKREKK